MLDVHSEEFKYRYNRSKMKAKQWEDEFKKENGRIPTKADIKLSSAKIRHYYNVYWQLKTRLLEETILGGSDAGGENANASRRKSGGVLKEHTNIIEHDKSHESSAKVGNPAISKDGSKENNESGKATKRDASTWGAHLNKPRSRPSDVGVKDNFLNLSVCEKLFEGSQFKKRNPRKSLRRLKSDSSQGKSFGSGDTFGSVDSTEDASFPCPAPCSVEKDCSPKIKALIMSKTELSPMFANGEAKLRVVAETKTVSNQAISLVERLATEPKGATLPGRKIDAGWIERCTLEGKMEPKLSTDSGFESSSLGSSEDGKVVVSDDDDDDIIAGSDNEQDARREIFLPVKRKNEEASPRSSTEGEQVAKKMKLDPYKFSPVKEDPKMIRLEKKIKAGSLNDNFVRINIKKKVFVRGKKNFNFTRHKKKQWKELKEKGLEAGDDAGIVRCYKCGDVGHFARYCQKTMKEVAGPGEDARGQEEEEEEEESQLPTLEEAEAMAREKAKPKKANLFALPDSLQVHAEEPAKISEALYARQEDGNPPPTPPEVFEALKKFGHGQFRVGQEEAVMRILSGMSTLVVVATGGGKSLCYQLPAYLYAKNKNCISLVVSPLVSLMEDQVSGSSSFFKLGCLHTSQTPKQRQSVIDDAKNGKLYALLVSPEAIVSGDSSSSGLCSVLKSLPPIAFACIDEVHCLSQWSHNFRPSYLVLAKVLKEKLGVRTILGLTATATKSTIESITKELGIADAGGVIKDVPLPDNLRLSVSTEEKKDEALLNLLRGERFRDANAILIYCTRRDECERLAVMIRTVLNGDPGRQTSKRLSWNAESYHAGMTFARRKQVQRAFLKGNLRIVVATIAFGMGINKSDIRGVIHYDMPRDFESFVQEVGRAGRDGLPADCHVFLDANGRDLCELKRFIHSNTVDRHVLRKLLQRVFVECKCRDGPCPGHEVAFDCDDTIRALDIPEEVILTLLCYLELHEAPYVKVLACAFAKCKIASYHGERGIVAAARKCPPLAVACALDPSLASGGSANVVDIANAISWDSGAVKSQLKAAEWTRTGDGRPRKSGLSVDFSGLAFRVVSRGDMAPEELDGALDYLASRVDSQERRARRQLEATFSTLKHFARRGNDGDGLKSAIRHYFETESIPGDIAVESIAGEDFDEEAVAADVRALICNYRDNSFNSRAVARIFHGIQSPNYPASIWFKCRHWRQHVDKDFNRICKVATREILRLK